MHEHLKEKLAILPDQPGCYLMKDQSGNDYICRKSERY